MLSNPAMGLPAEQRLHRRQNSTPSAFELAKTPTMPNANHQRPTAGHRRGLSLDTCQQQHHQQHHHHLMATAPMRQDHMVSITTNNHGLAANMQHHALQETQHQLQAQPGTPRRRVPQHAGRRPPPHQRHPPGPPPPQGPPHQFNPLALGDRENYLLSPHGTPQSHQFHAATCFDGSPIPIRSGQATLSTPVDMLMLKNQESFVNNMGEAKGLDLFGDEGHLGPSAFVGFPGSPAAQNWNLEDGSRRDSKRISYGILERVHKFEHMGMEGFSPQRPMTPPNQNGIGASTSLDRTTYERRQLTESVGCYPPTPMETPHDRTNKHEPRPSRFNGDYDESLEETVKPIRNRSNLRTTDMFQEMRQQAEGTPAQPSPPRSNRMPNAKQFAGAPMQPMGFCHVATMRNQAGKPEERYDGLGLDAALQIGGVHHATPVDAQNPMLLARGFMGNGDLARFPPTAGDGAAPLAQSRRASPHRRTESVDSVASAASATSMASVASAASIASINIEETKTETGVTVEEIAQYIRGPETTDGKWMCLFEDCGKKFGRKENIKSHVQTHLNDRQYQCPTCKKCFVRQHDLKRHAKIHTGVKPYPCECGNSFARHDALTRHRQRGMCIGAFDGVVRKVVKRGRPRKNRPDMEERAAKSARQRRKNNMSISSTSSMSGYSDSSAANSPDNDYNMADDMEDVVLEHNDSFSSAPMPNMTATQPFEAASSPAAASVHSFNGPDDVMEKILSGPGTPARSAVSRYTTPPGLSRSSSPPPQQQQQQQQQGQQGQHQQPAPVFFEPEFGGSGVFGSMAAPMDPVGGMAESANMGATLPVNIGDQDGEMLLDFDGEGGLPHQQGLPPAMDRNGQMLMMPKFDEDFDGVNLFDDEDMFFNGAS